LVKNSLIVHNSNFGHPTSAVGQKHALPRRNINARFTSASGHYAGDLPVLPVAEPLGRYATTTLAPPKGRLIS
jgi:hypothetical protein